MVQVELQIAGGGEPVGSHLAGPDLAGLAAFTLDSRGRVASWPLAAAKLFGLAAGAAAGRDVRDVLLADPGQRALVDQVLAEVASGRVEANRTTSSPSMSVLLVWVPAGSLLNPAGKASTGRSSRMTILVPSAIGATGRIGH